MNSKIVSCLAIVVIGALECIALSRGIDGVIFAGSTALIGGIAGYQIKNNIHGGSKHDRAS